MKQDAFSHDAFMLDVRNMGTNMFLYLLFEQTSMLHEILKKHVEENHPPAKPHFDPFVPQRFSQKHYEATATLLDKNSKRTTSFAYQHAFTMAASWQQLVSGYYLRDFHYMSLLVQEVLVEASIFNQMKLDTVPEILNNITNKCMYLDTTSRIFAKKVRDNYPEVGKLGVSTHGHIVSQKQDEYNCIYIFTDEKIPVEVLA